jgi:hypothetical protein
MSIGQIAAWQARASTSEAAGRMNAGVRRNTAEDENLSEE